MLGDVGQLPQGRAAAHVDEGLPREHSPALPDAAAGGSRKRWLDGPAAGGLGPLSSRSADIGDAGALLAALARLQPGQTLTVAPLPDAVPAAAGAAADMPPAGKRPRRAAARGALALLQVDQLAEEDQLVGPPLAQQLQGRMFQFSVAGQAAGMAGPWPNLPAVGAAHAASAATHLPAAAALAAARPVRADAHAQPADARPPPAAAAASALAAAAPAPAAGLAPPSPFASGAGSHHPVHGVQQPQQPSQQQHATASTAQKVEQQPQRQGLPSALLSARQGPLPGPFEAQVHQPSIRISDHRQQQEQWQQQWHH